MLGASGLDLREVNLHGFIPAPEGRGSVNKILFNPFSTDPQHGRIVSILKSLLPEDLEVGFLNLANRNLIDEDLDVIFQHIVSVNVILRVDLSRNKLTGSRESSLHNFFTPFLLEIDLPDNFLSDAFAKNVRKFFKNKSNALKTIVLERNPFRAAGYYYLKKNAEKNPGLSLKLAPCTVEGEITFPMVIQDCDFIFNGRAFLLEIFMRMKDPGCEELESWCLRELYSFLIFECAINRGIDAGVLLGDFLEKRRGKIESEKLLVFVQGLKKKYEKSSNALYEFPDNFFDVGVEQPFNTGVGRAISSVSAQGVKLIKKASRVLLEGVEYGHVQDVVSCSLGRNVLPIYGKSKDAFYCKAMHSDLAAYCSAESAVGWKVVFLRLPGVFDGEKKFSVPPEFFYDLEFFADDKKPDEGVFYVRRKKGKDNVNVLEYKVLSVRGETVCGVLRCGVDDTQEIDCSLGDGENLSSKDLLGLVRPKFRSILEAVSARDVNGLIDTGPESMLRRKKILVVHYNLKNEGKNERQIAVYAYRPEGQGGFISYPAERFSKGLSKGFVLQDFTGRREINYSELDEESKTFLRRIGAYTRNEIMYGQRLKIALKVARGFGLIHAANIVHRDIKTPNILIDEAGEEVRICDFGDARIYREEAERETVHGHGSWQWMAPEVLGLALRVMDQGSNDERSEVFSFGTVLCCLFDAGGKYPYEHYGKGGEMQRIRESRINESVRPILDKGCPEKIAAIIRKCWAQDPISRYQGMPGLIADLDDVQRSLEIADSERMFAFMDLGLREEALRFFLEIEKVDPFVCDRSGRPALHVAIDRGCDEVVFHILHKFPEVLQCKDRSGKTALHTLALKNPDYGVFHCRRAMVSMMLKIEPRIVMVQDGWGKLASDLALESKNFEMAFRLIVALEEDFQAAFIHFLAATTIHLNDFAVLRCLVGDSGRQEASLVEIIGDKESFLFKFSTVFVPHNAENVTQANKHFVSKIMSLNITPRWKEVKTGDTLCHKVVAIGCRMLPDGVEPILKEMENLGFDTDIANCRGETPGMMLRRLNERASKGREERCRARDTDLLVSFNNTLFARGGLMLRQEKDKEKLASGKERKEEPVYCEVDEVCDLRGKIKLDNPYTKFDNEVAKAKLRAKKGGEEANNDYLRERNIVGEKGVVEEKPEDRSVVNTAKDFAVLAVVGGDASVIEVLRSFVPMEGTYITNRHLVLYRKMALDFVSEMARRFTLWINEEIKARIHRFDLLAKEEIKALWQGGGLVNAAAEAVLKSIDRYIIVVVLTEYFSHFYRENIEKYGEVKIDHQSRDHKNYLRAMLGERVDYLCDNLLKDKEAWTKEVLACKAQRIEERQADYNLCFMTSESLPADFPAKSAVTVGLFFHKDSKALKCEQFKIFFRELEDMEIYSGQLLDGVITLPAALLNKHKGDVSSLMKKYEKKIREALSKDTGLRPMLTPYGLISALLSFRRKQKEKAFTYLKTFFEKGRRDWFTSRLSLNFFEKRSSSDVAVVSGEGTASGFFAQGELRHVVSHYAFNKGMALYEMAHPKKSEMSPKDNLEALSAYYKTHGINLHVFAKEKDGRICMLKQYSNVIDGAWRATNILVDGTWEKRGDGKTDIFKVNGQFCNLVDAMDFFRCTLFGLSPQEFLQMIKGILGETKPRYDVLRMVIGRNDVFTKQRESNKSYVLPKLIDDLVKVLLTAGDKDKAILAFLCSHVMHILYGDVVFLPDMEEESRHVHVARKEMDNFRDKMIQKIKSGKLGSEDRKFDLEAFKKDLIVLARVYCLYRRALADHCFSSLSADISEVEEMALCYYGRGWSASRKQSSIRRSDGHLFKIYFGLRAIRESAGNRTNGLSYEDWVGAKKANCGGDGGRVAVEFATRGLPQDAEEALECSKEVEAQYLQGCVLVKDKEKEEAIKRAEKERQEKEEAMKREEKERQEKEKERQEKEEAMKEVARLKEYVRKMEEAARRRGGDFLNGGNFFGTGGEVDVSKGVGCRGAEDVEASEKEAAVKREGLREEGKGL